MQLEGLVGFLFEAIQHFSTDLLNTLSGGHETLRRKFPAGDVKSHTWVEHIAQGPHHAVHTILSTPPNPLAYRSPSMYRLDVDRGTLLHYSLLICGGDPSPLKCPTRLIGMLPAKSYHHLPALLRWQVATSHFPVQRGLGNFVRGARAVWMPSRLLHTGQMLCNISDIARKEILGSYILNGQWPAGRRKRSGMVM